LADSAVPHENRSPPVGSPWPGLRAKPLLNAARRLVGAMFR
jgi:hypothetical protein